jgi:hypothetical protein
VKPASMWDIVIVRFLRAMRGNQMQPASEGFRRVQMLAETASERLLN